MSEFIRKRHAERRLTGAAAGRMEGAKLRGQPVCVGFSYPKPKG